MMKRLLFFILIFSSVSFAQASESKLKVVATFSILGDMIHNVTGESVDLKVLVGPNADAHTFEPTPQDSIALAQADIIFENGIHLEHWLDDLYQASGSSAKRVVVTDGLALRILATGENDPHVWQNVKNVIQMVSIIRSALVEADPHHRDVYQANAQEYIQQLQTLDQWIQSQIGLIPEGQRNLVTSHDALGYLADAYGLKMIGAVIPSATTEAEDPSARQIVELIKTIQSTGVKVIFIENMRSSKLVQAISQDIKIKVAPALYTDALGLKDSQGDTYIHMMKSNVDIIVEALK